MTSKSWLQRLLYPLFVLAMIPVCFEGALWLLQYRPYRQVAYSIHAEPQQCVIADPDLGFALRPGTYRITLNDSLRYQVTHGADSLRITSDSPRPDSLPEIWLMGCSFTYGMGVNDEETFAWKLQEQLPHFRVRNFGVPGFGTVQSWMQLQRKLQKGHQPALVVLLYADFHDERNVLSPRYRHALSVGFRQADSAIQQVMTGSLIPYCRLRSPDQMNPDSPNHARTLTPETLNPVPLIPDPLTLDHCPWDSLYQDWRGRDVFASVNFWQTFSDNIHQADLSPREVTRELIQDMQHRCGDIPFFVAGLTQSQETTDMLTTLAEAGLHTADISLDLNDPAWNHLPWDSHPNAKAHAVLAERLEQEVKAVLAFR